MKIWPQTRLDAIDALAERLGLGACDAILAGDGSGSGWATPCGWCCILIDRRTRARKLFYGFQNNGTSVVAEAAPYLQALNWYRARLAAKKLPPTARVCVVTDCKVLVDVATAVAAGDKPLHESGALLPYIAAFQALGRAGLSVAWTYAPRVTTALNCFADDVAGKCAALSRAVEWPVDADGRPIWIDDCNPDDPNRAPRNFRRGAKRSRREVDDEA